MGDDRLRGYDPARRKGKERYRVHWPQPDRPLTVTLLDSGWDVIPLHWDTSDKEGRPRSRLCVGLPDCRFCADGVELRPAGYIPAWHGASGTVIIVCIPWESLQMALTLRGAHASQRGLCVRFTRRGHNAGPISAQILQPVLTDPDSIPTPDIWPTMVALYGPRVRPNDQGDLFGKDGQG
jgi:hypothetical protein